MTNRGAGAGGGAAGGRFGSSADDRFGGPDDINHLAVRSSAGMCGGLRSRKTEAVGEQLTATRVIFNDLNSALGDFPRPHRPQHSKRLLGVRKGERAPIRLAHAPTGPFDVRSPCELLFCGMNTRCFGVKATKAPCQRIAALPCEYLKSINVPMVKC